MQLIKKQFDEINAKEELNKTKNLELLKKEDVLKHEEKVQRKREQEIRRQQSMMESAEDAKKKKKKNKKGKKGDDDDENKSKDSSDEEEEDEEVEKKHRRRHALKITLDENMDNARPRNGEMSNDEIEERKKNFFRTIRNKSGWSIFVNIIVGLIFSAYFVQMNYMHNRFEVGIQTLRNNLPYFFDRYRSLILSYSLLRERIINNNTLETYERYEFYNWNLDNLYIEQSSKIEQDLLRLKNDHP